MFCCSSWVYGADLILISGPDQACIISFLHRLRWSTAAPAVGAPSQGGGLPSCRVAERDLILRVSVNRPMRRGLRVAQQRTEDAKQGTLEGLAGERGGQVHV